MFRNNYDNDSVTFSPQGRIFQVEYAQEAVKQGSVVVGIVSKTHVVLAALKVPSPYSPYSPSLNLPSSRDISPVSNHSRIRRSRANNAYLPPQRNAEELSSYQKKIIPIDTHYGLALAGLASDARVLSNFMKQQSLAERLTLARPIPLSNIISQIASRAQSNTQQYGRRPYGVGLLVAGADASGTHLYEFQPSGMTQEMVADAIGARSQMARTYLERKMEEFGACGKDELVGHALRALKESLPQDKELGVDNTSLGVGGVGEAFELLEGEKIRGWLESAAAEKGEVASAAETEEQKPAGETMDVDT